MKTIEKNRKLERSGNFKEQEFKIKANAKAFRILSDGLYSDKIRAIIRELSCNAYDAHVEAGTLDIPFDVHLPTPFHPLFYIRDYGTGLSKADIEEIYTTYFESTKTDTNDEVGCLGLGSKSPFSYVDMFTITSFLQGKQYVYSALLNEAGTPTIALISESDTDEKNGLKVQFSVKKNDIHEFKYKAESIFFYFEHRPNFVGNVPSIRKREYITQNGVWGLSANRNGNAVAVMGNVAYPVSLDKVDFSADERSILRSFPLDIFYDIGDLEITPSRESLSYDEKTTNAIRERVQGIIAFEKERVQKEVEKHNNYWDASLWFWEEKERNKIVELLFNHVKVKYKDRIVAKMIGVNMKDYHEIDENCTLTRVFYHSSYRRRYSNETVVKSEPCARIKVGKRSAFFLNDCTSRHMLRVKKFLEENGHVSDVYLFKSSNKKIIEQIRKEMGMGEDIKIRMLSEIEPPKAIRAKREVSAFGNFVKMSWDDNCPIDNSSYWSNVKDEDNFDINEGGFYVPISRWKTVHNNETQSPHEFLHKLNAMYKLICPNMLHTVYGVKVAKVKSLEKRDDWINWFDFVQEIIRQYALLPNVHDELQTFINSEDVDYGKTVKLFRSINRYPETRHEDGLIGKSTWMKQCKCPVLKELAKRYDKQKRCTSKGIKKITRLVWDHISEGYSTLTTDEVKAIRQYSAKNQELLDEFGQRYPFFLDFDKFYGGPIGINNLLDYINAMVQYKLYK